VSQSKPTHKEDVQGHAHDSRKTSRLCARELIVGLQIPVTFGT